VQVGTNTTRTITFGTGANEVNSIEELEDELGQIAGARAEIDSDTGAVTITATNGNDQITVTSTDSTDVAKASVGAAFGLSAGVTQPTTTQSTERDELQDQFNELLLQIDELAEDSGFNGVNLLNGGSLNVLFNEDGSSELDITGVDFSSQGLGLSRVATDYFQTDSNIASTMELLETAVSTLRPQASQIGSNLSIVETREDFTRDMINTLETGAANLTLADTNEEGANLTALQTRQQLSTTAQSLATQADQNVLRLL
ncbi:MAG: flagellin, partial [Cohaesibacteraceae bacterium]